MPVIFAVGIPTKVLRVALILILSSIIYAACIFTKLICQSINNTQQLV